MRRSYCRNNFSLVAGFAILANIPAHSQGQVLDLSNGPVPVVTKYDKVVQPGSSQATRPGAGLQPTAGLPFYSANYTLLGGAQLPFQIVGTNPALGANTTTIPTVLVPLKFVFPNPGHPTLDGTNVVALNVNSPIFRTADYTVGGTDLGVTQFGDALQRAEFWNLPGFSQNYHVLLGTPAVAPTVTISVPSGLGNAFRLTNGKLVGVVDDTFFDEILAALLPSYSANELPIFITDNVFLGANGLLVNCCTLGFHDSQGPPLATAKTWIFAAYTEPGTFAHDIIADVQPLSHEVAEWLNDPFLGVVAVGGINLIPPAVLPGTGGTCIFNFETGDPLESPPVVFTKVTNGTTYHLQDNVFLPWYLHTTPSFSVNRWYTFLNTFTTFSKLCGPG